MKGKILLTSIFVLALLLRFVLLSSNPPSLTWDEVSWGYNAYVLGQSGIDEFGKFLPITFLESFGDFKPPMYAYLTILPVFIFGLTEFATRFASAFFGSLTILLTYFLVLEIFYSAKQKKTIALLSSFILAISPWHILLSRAAFEANVATFFIVLGVLLFLFSTRDKKNLRYLCFSFLAFLAAAYTFNTSRVFLPLFVPILVILKRKILLQNWKYALAGVVPALLLSLPLLLFLITPQAKLRYQEVNIFSDIKVIERTNLEIQNDNNSIVSKVLHNRRFAYGVEYMAHYLDNLDPKFLFIKGDGNPKFSIQDVGEMYIWELPFLVIGALLLFRKKEGNWMIIPFWIILGIAPAATARETPHALRIETIVPTFQILVAYGLFYIYEFVSHMKGTMEKGKYLLYACFVVFVALNFLYFAHSYFIHYPVTYATEWQYGYKNAVIYAESVKANYKKIYFTQDLGRPYMYVLFYGKYKPGTLSQRANITREALGFVHVNSFGKYNFPSILPKPDNDNLYIDTPRRVPTSAHILKKFYSPNGEVALVAYEN